MIKFKYKSKNLKFNAALVYTGIKSGTGGRIAIAYKKLKLDEDFLMTYGDGLSNVSIKNLVKFHYKNKSDVTLTAVRPKQRYGILDINKNRVKAIDNSKEKKVNVYIMVVFL